MLKALKHQFGLKITVTKLKEFRWNENFAYAIGLFVADGHLSKDKRHLEFTSKDFDQVQNFINCLGLNCIITKKTRSKESEKKYFHAQFSNVNLYRFFNSVGIENNKSLTINKVLVPEQLMPDFLRGLLDGDGSITIFSHPESQYKQVRIRFASASYKFLDWLKNKLKSNVSGGYIHRAGGCWQLIYAKSDSIKLARYMYYNKNVISLARKREIADNCLSLQARENSVKSLT